MGMLRALTSILIVALAWPACADVPRSKAQIDLSFAPVVKAASPAVVNIQAARRIGGADPFANDPFFQFFFGQRRPAQEQVESSLGSGVILDAAGLVVTNHHVIEGADAITVILADRRSFPAEVVLRDERSDLAVLRVDAKGERLPTLAFAGSDAIEVGDLVLAIGNPFGIGQSVTSGIVSAKDRTAQGLDRDISFIQTDAAVNPGNSGGALVDMQGRLVGINTAIFSRSGGSIGIGFAIPAKLVQNRLDAARRGDSAVVAAPLWTGLDTAAVDGETAAALGLDRPRGVAIRRVHPDGPGARAGLVPGDVILAVNGTAVDDPAALGYRLSLAQGSRAAEVEVLRKGRSRAVALAPEPLPERPPAELTELPRRHPLAGAVVANLSPAFNTENGIDPFETGVAIVRIARGSPAADLGLRPGDIIASLGNTEIATVAHLLAVSRGAARGTELAIRRGGRALRGRLD